MIVYLDTNIVIYFTEQPPVFGPKAFSRLRQAVAAGDTLAVCHLTRMECRVKPLKRADARLIADYDIFFADPGILMVAITAAVCDRAAVIRAAHNFKPMDALQLAAAVENGCGIFLTNDTRLSRFPDISIEVLP